MSCWGKICILFLAVINAVVSPVTLKLPAQFVGEKICFPHFCVENLRRKTQNLLILFPRSGYWQTMIPAAQMFVLEEIADSVYLRKFFSL